MDAFIQRVIKNVKRILRNTIYFILIGGGIIAGIIVGVMLRNDLHGNEAKKYLMEKYGFEQKDLFVDKVTEYVDSEKANCDTLWLKKCTDDKNLAAKYVIKVKKGNVKIEVTEDSKSKFTDNYNAETTKEWKEKEEKEKEVERQREEQLKKDREALEKSK